MEAKTPTTARDKATIAILILCSVAGNYFKITVAYNVDFLFGSIFTIILLLFYPARYGVLSSILAGSYTYQLWNHPYAWLIIVGEAVVVAFGLSRRKSDLIFLDLFYWLLIGMPLVWIFYSYAMNMAFQPVLVVVLKQGLNGVFNAILANLAQATVRGIRHWRFGRATELVRYQDLLFLTMVCAILVPAVTIIIFFSRYELTRSKQAVTGHIEQTSAAIRGVIASWLEENSENIKTVAQYAETKGKLVSPDLIQLLRSVGKSEDSFIKLGICNSAGIATAMDPPLDPGKTRPDFSGLDYFQEMKNSPREVISGVLKIPYGDDKPEVHIAHPILKDGNFAGFVFGSLDLSEVFSMLKLVVSKWILDITIVDGNGLVIGSTIDDYVPQRDNKSMLTELFARPFGQVFTHTRGVPPNISVMRRWEDSFFYEISKLSDPVNWRMMVEAPVRPYIGSIFRILIHSLALMMCTLIATITLARLLSFKITKPLLELQTMSTGLPEKISDNIEITWPSSGVFEFNSLVENIRDMADVLVRKFRELKYANVNLDEARDEAERAARAKSAFLASMSHEIRTPLNGVIGMTDLLLETKLNTEQAHFARIAQSSAKALLALINDILDLSKIEAGSLELERLALSPQTLVEDILDIVSPTAHEKGLDLWAAFHGEPPSQVLGDPTRLRQLLFNLVGNAVKFTEQGHVGVTLITQKKSDQLCLRFEIVDSGIGIEPEQVLSIFDPFSQADSSTTRHYGGTGLGLSICKRLVEIMGGEIGVESTPGRGSTFWFQLSMEEVRQGPNDVREDDRRLWGIEVMCVDHNAGAAASLARRLVSLGVDCQETSNGIEAMARLRAAHMAGRLPKIVFVDLQFNAEDGLRLAQTIREDPEISRVHLVALKPLAAPNEDGRLASVVYDRILHKPVRLQQLKECLLSLLESGQTSTGNGAASDGEKKFTPTRPARILLVEDNKVNQQVAIHMLTRMGYSVDLAVNGIEALMAVERVEYDLVLMDCEMPEMDGFETTKRIRARGDMLSRVPIIAMTAHALPGDRKRCLAAGMDDYLTKPIDPRDLAAKLGQQLGGEECTNVSSW